MKTSRRHLLVCTLFMSISGFCAASADSAPPDLLTYKNGERLQGTVVSQADGMIVFRSINLGEVRVRADAVTLSKLEPPAPKPPPPPPPPPPSEKKPATEEPVALWLAFFKTWHGRVAFSTETVADLTNRSSVAFDLNLSRKWKQDEVQANGRYDYSTINETIRTFMLKADLMWRHNFSAKWFAHYRPKFERSRGFLPTGVLNTYKLMQHELGLGMNLLSAEKRQVRVGLSEDLVDVWNSAPDTSHTSRGVESGFLESEFKMPWRLLLTQRGIYYYSLTSPQSGWENNLELTKKLTDKLSTALRYEVRRNHPDERVPDYHLLRLMLGLNF